MRILYVTQEFPIPATNGIRLKVFELLRLLGDRHEIYLISFYSHGDHPAVAALEAFGCRVVGVFPVVNPRPSILLAASSIVSPEPFSLRRYENPEFIAVLHSFLVRQPIDLVHFDMVNMARFWAYAAGKATVIAPNDCTTLFLLRSSKLSTDLVRKMYLWVQSRKMAAFEARVFSRFTKCYVVSETDRQYLKRLNPGIEVECIPLSVDTVFFSPHEPGPSNRSLVFTGNMGSERNVDAVFSFVKSILPRVQAEFPDVTFWVVGENPPPRLVALANQEKHIVVTGRVDDIRPYLNGAMVYVCPLKLGSGMKSRLLQAMSMAKPVVTTSVGAENIEVIPGVHLHVAEEADAFANGVIRLLKDREAALRMGLTARELMRAKYDSRYIARKVEALYETALEKAYRRQGAG